MKRPSRPRRDVVVGAAARGSPRTAPTCRSSGSTAVPGAWWRSDTAPLPVLYVTASFAAVDAVHHPAGRGQPGAGLLHRGQRAVGGPGRARVERPVEADHQWVPQATSGVGRTDPVFSASRISVTAAYAFGAVAASVPTAMTAASRATNILRAVRGQLLHALASLRTVIDTEPPEENMRTIPCPPVERHGRPGCRERPRKAPLGAVPSSGRRGTAVERLPGADNATAYIAARELAVGQGTCATSCDSPDEQDPDHHSAPPSGPPRLPRSARLRGTARRCAAARCDSPGDRPGHAGAAPRHRRRARRGVLGTGADRPVAERPRRAGRGARRLRRRRAARRDASAVAARPVSPVRGRADDARVRVRAWSSAPGSCSGPVTCGSSSSCCRWPRA